VAAPEPQEIGRVQRRSIQLGLLVVLVLGFVPFLLALLTWTRVDVACSRASARDLSCTVVTDELFSRKAVTLELLGTTRLDAIDVTLGSGKQRTKTQRLQAHASGAVVVLCEHPQVARALPPLQAFLADPSRSTVQTTTGRSTLAYVSLVAFFAIVILGLWLSMVGGTTVVAIGERPSLLVERRWAPGLSTRREVPLARLSHLSLFGGRPRNPLRLVLQGGEEVFLYLATEQDQAELAALIDRARSIHADGHDSPTPSVRA